jgi:site-specific DNA-methyltransferase (adenine-specific)
MDFIEENKNKIICGDCLDVMKLLPDKSIDCIICDLPYGTTACHWDIVIPFEPLWIQYKRIIKDNGAICLFGMQPFTSDLINSNREMFRYDLIWYKPLPMRNHEEVLLFYKKIPTYNPIKTNGVRKTGKRLQNTNGDNYGKFTMKDKNRRYDNKGINLPQSIITISNGDRTKESEHPTQKPVKLYEYLIKTYSNEGDLLFDNASGSGTLAVASHNLKRNFICIEKDKDYYDKSVIRYEKHILQYGINFK